MRKDLVSKIADVLAGEVTADALREVSVMDRDFMVLPDLRIETKETTLARFWPNPPQKWYLSQIYPEYARTDARPPRISGKREFNLKGRQMGFSTLWAGLYYLDTVLNPHTHTVMIAYDQEGTERLFQMVQRFYKHTPERFKPKERFANRKEYLWPELDSSFFVGTAGKDDFGRGVTVRNVHASEIAMWNDAGKIFAGLMQGVPRGGNITIESTANGMGNWFHTEWNKALDGRSRFKPRFFPWFRHPDYVATPEEVDEYWDGPIVEQEPDGVYDEAQMMRLYNLSVAQMVWYRLKRQEFQDPRVIKQEYPNTPNEAFLATGNAFFSLNVVREMEGAMAPPLEIPLGLLLPEWCRNVLRECRA